MSLPVMHSTTGFNSDAAQLLAAPHLEFRLVEAVVHASAKLSTAANETIAWIRFSIFDSSISLLHWSHVFYAETCVQFKLDGTAQVARLNIQITLGLGFRYCSLVLQSAS